MHRLGRAVYCPANRSRDPWAVILAWATAMPADAVFSGPTAAWMYGLDADPIRPVEVTVPPGSGVRSRGGLRIRHRKIGSDDIVKIRGQRVTSISRTLCDLCPRLVAVDALVVLDGALRRGLVNVSSLMAHRKLQRLAQSAAPAESPMETRLRWLLLKSRLPRPEVQVDLHDADGAFVGRADLYYPQSKLVVEYDGGNHRERLIEDDRRQNLLVNAGFQVLRFTSADMAQRPEQVVDQVCRGLGRPSSR